MTSRRVTQRDVARKARVHHSTVSLALSGDPRIPVATCARVKRVAGQLGYKPDPMLSALASYRTRHRPVVFHGTLAWLVNTTATYDWREVPHYRDYHVGAMARAVQSGFQLELFDYNATGMRPERLAAILRSRSISGLLLCPQPQANFELEFPWQDFSAVTFGYTLSKPRLHTVTTNLYRAVAQITDELRRRGYRRIGCSFAESFLERSDFMPMAGFLVRDDGMRRRPVIPPLLGPSRKLESVRPWIERYKPDAIISGNYLILDLLREMKIKVPDDLGVACPCLPVADPRLTGVIEGSQHIGGAAVDLLVSMLHRGERGIPERPQRTHIEGLWNPGQSLRS